MSGNAASERERRLETALRIIAGQEAEYDAPEWADVLAAPADRYNPAAVARAALEEK